MTESTETADSPARPRRRGTTWIAIAVILLAAAVTAYVFNGRFGQDPRLVESPLIGRPLADLTLPYLEESGSLSLADLRGEILVLNFWASWCFPCRLEHPALTAASAAYADRGVHFVGIVYQDRPNQAIAFLDEFGRGVNYSYVVDSESRATVELGVFGVPETFFVDADGIIRGRVQGEIDPIVLVDTIEDLLAGRTPNL